MESKEHQTDIIKCDELEEGNRNERLRKIKVRNYVEVPQELVLNYKAEEIDENVERTIIKVEKIECSDDILPQIAVEHYEPKHSIENQTNVLVKLEHYCGKLENISHSSIGRREESKTNKHRKIKLDELSQNVETSQDSMQNCEADKYEGNKKSMIIKVEKFECSDDILPQVAVEHYEPKQSIENQTNVLVKLQHRCEKLENVSRSTIGRIEQSKKIEEHRKIKLDEFSQNVETFIHKTSIQNYKAEEIDENVKRKIIKVEKIECSDDILPQIAVDYYESEQNRDNRNNLLVKSELCCDKLSKTSQDIFNESLEYKGNQRNKDSTAIVASAVYEVSVESNSSRKPYLKRTRSGGNLNEKQNHEILNVIDEFESINDNYKDTISSELTQDGESKSVNVEASKVLVTDPQCYVALEKLSYKCDICRYVTVIKDLLVSHMKLHNFNQTDSISECELQFKNQIISEKCEYKQLSDKPFACDLGSYKSARKSSFNRHILTHTGEKPFACNLCSYKTADKSNLNRHKLKHTGEKSFACNLCSYKSADKSVLNRHIFKHTGEKPFACNLCSYKSTQKSILNRHILTHIGEKPFACNLCSYKTADKSNLNRHILTHTGEKSFACNLCSYKSADKSVLNRHIFKHTGEKPFACNLCSYKSTQKSYLNRHILTHTGEKPFACNLCSYKTADKSHLNIHILTHTGEKPFACNLCSYKSTQKSSLNRHILTHTGEKPFACNLCSYKTADISNLNTHKLKHTGEKPFACNLCLYKTTDKSHLNRHILTHTGEKPFACYLCSYKSARKSDLNRHIFKHTDEKPFACYLCSYKSARKSALSRHILTHTGEKSCL